MKSHRGHPRNSFFRSVVVLLFLLFSQSRYGIFNKILRNKKLHPADICPKYKVQTCRKCPEKKRNWRFWGTWNLKKNYPAGFLFFPRLDLEGVRSGWEKKQVIQVFFYRRKKNPMFLVPRCWNGVRNEEINGFLSSHARTMKTGRNSWDARAPTCLVFFEGCTSSCNCDFLAISRILSYKKIYFWIILPPSFCYNVGSNSSSNYSAVCYKKYGNFLCADPPDIPVCTLLLLFWVGCCIALPQPPCTLIFATLYPTPSFPSKRKNRIRRRLTGVFAAAPEVDAAADMGFPAQKKQGFWALKREHRNCHEMTLQKRVF